MISWLRFKILGQEFQKKHDRAFLNSFSPPKELAQAQLGGKNGVVE